MTSSAVSVVADGAPGERSAPELTLVRAICGPTGAGKSALALRLAARCGLAIVSADSRQVYRGFDIGTAKPNATELRTVTHFGIDVVDPTERYSAAQWSSSFEEWRERALRLGREPLVVGGTGLYLRTLDRPLFAEPALDASRRAALAEHLASLSTDALRRWTLTLDQPRAHLGRTQLLRAVEIALLTGHRLSRLHDAAERPTRYRVRYLVVDPGRDVLRARIAERADTMLATGWIDEVAELLNGVADDAPAWNGTGYALVRRHVRGELSLHEARERIVIETRQYAKRQRTWFRHQLAAADVQRVDPDAPNADDIVLAWWHGDRDRGTSE